VCVVALANFFCHLKRQTSLGVRHATLPPMQLFTALGLRKAHVALILEQLDPVLSAADAMASSPVR
jgi:hypothetical protein